MYCIQLFFYFQLLQQIILYISDLARSLQWHCIVYIVLFRKYQVNLWAPKATACAVATTLGAVSGSETETRKYWFLNVKR